ncbi:hypothetical protein Tco_1275035 [Tanacetum coccineum]
MMTMMMMMMDKIMKFSTHDEEDNEEEGSDLRFQTPSHYESTDDEESDEVTHGANVKGEELDEEKTNEEDEVNELYRDVNVNLEGRNTEMTDAPRTIIQTNQVIEDTHVIITPVNPEDILVTTIAKTPLSSATTLPPPTIPLITHLQQTPVPTPITVPSSSLQYLPNFGSLFEFDHRLNILETDFSEFKQTNQFASAVSLIPGIIDAYLANKMHEAVKTIDQVKEQVKAQVSNILLKFEKTVNEQLEDELKKILIDKMESNKSIHRSDEQKNLYKALVDAYESDKLILDTYGDNVSFKRRRDDEDKDEEPSVGSNQGVSHHKSVGESAQAEEPRHIAKDLEEPAHLEFETEVNEDQPDEETFQLPDWFKKPAKPPTPDRDWNKTLPDAHGHPFPTFELMKGSCKSLVELEYFFEEVYKATTDQLDWNNPEGQQYPHDL